MDNQNSFNEFEKLTQISDRLMGPEGCPWDREQTLPSMRQFILEEAYEIVEAIDEEDDKNLAEEIGDLFFNLLFLCKIAEKEGRFTTSEVFRKVGEKLIGRHPHVFGETKLEGSQAVLEQWEKIKKQEKSERKSILDGIPKSLPALSRAYKIVAKIPQEGKELESTFVDEGELGKLLWAIVRQAKKQKIHPEMALRKTTQEIEKKNAC